MERMHVIHLQGTHNVRDLGGTPLDGGRVLKQGLLYRGSALNSLTEDDRSLLFDTLDIQHVVDLRCGWERIEKPNTVDPRASHTHLPFFDKELVGIEYEEPAAGTKIVGKDVACEPLRFYRTLANPLTVAQMAKGVHLILNDAAQGKPVYFHCSGGKDRAGIMALLLLSVLKANPEAILEDYLYTNVSRDKQYDRMFERFLRLAQGDPQRAHELVVSHRALPENLVAFADEVTCRYGSWENFLEDGLHVDHETQERWITACSQPHDKS